MELTPKQQQDIGLPFVLDRLLPLSPLGREQKRALRPYARNERTALQRELNNLAKAVALGNHPALARFRQGLMQLRDIRGTVGMLGQRPLDQVELFELKRYLLLLQGLAADFDSLQAEAHWEGIVLHHVPEALAILDPEGDGNPAFSLRSSWSADLAAIRAEKAEIEKRIAQAKCETREALLTERTGIVAREAAAEQSLCAALSQKLLPYKQDMTDSLDALSRLDLLLAKAALVRELGGVLPTLTDRELSFVGMVHPAIADRLKGQGAAFTPLSLSLSPGAAVLTGANMGGKSVCLKTLALNVYLTHCGLFPFAETAQVPFFDDLCLIRGEGEDGREGLSSFGGELMAADAAARAVRDGFLPGPLRRVRPGHQPRRGGEAPAGGPCLFRHLRLHLPLRHPLRRRGRPGKPPVPDPGHPGPGRGGGPPHDRRRGGPAHGPQTVHGLRHRGGHRRRRAPKGPLRGGAAGGGGRAAEGHPKGIYTLR